MADPKPDSDEMVTLLYESLMEALDTVDIRFTQGDVMSACMHLAVDAGLQSSASAEQLATDLCDGVRKIISDRQTEGMTSQ